MNTVLKIVFKRTKKKRKVADCLCPRTKILLEKGERERELWLQTHLWTLWLVCVLMSF